MNLLLWIFQVVLAVLYAAGGYYKAVYARHSLKLTAANPLVWSLVMLVLVTIVAYGRFTSPPLA